MSGDSSARLAAPVKPHQPDAVWTLSTAGVQPCALPTSPVEKPVDPLVDNAVNNATLGGREFRDNEQPALLGHLYVTRWRESRGLRKPLSASRPAPPSLPLASE